MTFKRFQHKKSKKISLPAYCGARGVRTPVLNYSRHNVYMRSLNCKIKTGTNKTCFKILIDLVFYGENRS